MVLLLCLRKFMLFRIFHLLICFVSFGLNWFLSEVYSKLCWHRTTTYRHTWKEKNKAISLSEDALLAFSKVNKVNFGQGYFISTSWACCSVISYSWCIYCCRRWCFTTVCWQFLAFFSKRLKPAETRYSAFGRELLAIYLGIKHFRHIVEGRDFLW